MVYVAVEGDVRAYPLEILLWHEVINDVVGGIPVLVTYCPLSNTAITFDRRLRGESLQFGVSGLLRRSDLVIYDIQTESLWQQIGGTALVGDLVGAELPVIPSSIVSWAQLRDQFPEALVLSRNNGSGLRYGSTPYTLYDDTTARADSRRLFDGEHDDRLPFAERVVGISLNGAAVAFPFTLLAERRSVGGEVGGQAVTIFWTPGARSPLDQFTVDAGRDVGSAAAFAPIVRGRLLHFDPSLADPLTFVDRETGSVWNIFGQAASGELRGQELPPIAHGTHLWFAWAAFEPDTAIAP